MKFIKCLKRHNYVDYIGIVIDATKDVEFYTVTNIIQNKPNLFNYKVTNIRAEIYLWLFTPRELPLPRRWKVPKRTSE